MAPARCEYVLTVWLLRYDRLATEILVEAEVGLRLGLVAGSSK